MKVELELDEKFRKRIHQIAKGVKKLRKAGLTERGIILLVQDSIGEVEEIKAKMPQRFIKLVLDHSETIAEKYFERGRE